MKSFLSPGTSHKIMNSVLIFSGVLTISVLVIILAFILIEGLPAINLEFIFGSVKDQGRSGGILPIIVSSLYVTLISVLIAAPLGVGAAIYVVEYAENRKFVNIIRFGAETLASIPSIVFGLFGFAFFVMFLKMGGLYFQQVLFWQLWRFLQYFRLLRFH